MQLQSCAGPSSCMQFPLRSSCSATKPAVPLNSNTTTPSHPPMRKQAPSPHLGLLSVFVRLLERVAAADLLKQLREALGAAAGHLLNVALVVRGVVRGVWRVVEGG